MGEQRKPAPSKYRYFAYGSNIHRDNMSETCPDARPLEVARIPNHVVTFTGRSERWGGGTGTIGLAPGRDLWGGLYEIDPECRDRIEAEGSEAGYVWCFTSVQTVAGDRVRAGLLVKVRDLEPTAPSPEYIGLLEEGRRQWDLDPGELKGFPLHG